ncbi:hypothetical protein P4562_06810 [Lysinibacillus xylanilyticus]|uniref:hypothetical protein n=1 Tax=Lysinibacillus xylanilyticus TaxID=582475 RepID=UPI002E1FAD4A|nr:hypothetical protein [Lysinibacillus xylanilyticus]
MNLYLNLPSYGTIPVVNSKNQTPNSNVLTQITSTTSPFITKANGNITIRQSFWQPVPNVIRYTYKYLGNNQFQRLHTDPHSNLITNSNFPDTVFSNSVTYSGRLIGLILESPHEEEYHSILTSMIPIAPAQSQNATGGVIDREIEKLLEIFSLQQVAIPKTFQTDEIIHIVILNPIPYQTSLFHIHQRALKGTYCTLRNNVWKCIWNIPNVRSDFHSVLNRFSSNDILINCCTSQLQPILHTWLQNLPHTSAPHLLKGHHPSTLKMKGRWYQTIN